MATLYLDAFPWRVIRHVLREQDSTGRSTLGSELLALSPSRLNQAGGFLVRLLADGLLVVAVRSPDGDPFKSSYLLTDAGRHAAEYGEYQWEPKPRA